MSLRRGRDSICLKCRATVLIGLSDEVAGYTVYVDPVPIGPVGEFLALADGRHTYALHVALRKPRLSRRDKWQIAGAPAGARKTPRFDVVAEHACGKPLPTIPSAFTSPAPQGVDDEHPPF